jgi:hypothetical protein
LRFAVVDFRLFHVPTFLLPLFPHLIFPIIIDI